MAGVTLAAAVPLLAAACGTSTGGLSQNAAATTTSSLPANAVVGHPTPSAGDSLLSVSCPTASACLAVGSATGANRPVALVSGDGGARWHPGKLPVSSGQLTAVSCATRQACLAVGQGQGGAPVVVSTANAGRSWQRGSLPPGATALLGLDCTSGTSCITVASQSSGVVTEITRDAGRAWSAGGTLPAAMSQVRVLSCFGRQDCAVAGYTSTGPGKGTGAIAVSSDGGTSWSAASVPAGTGPLSALSCRPKGSCLAVAATSPTTGVVPTSQAELLVSSDGGRTWAAQGALDLSRGDGIACPTASTCTVVGTLWSGPAPGTPKGNVLTTSDGGRSWRAPPLYYVPGGLLSVTCPTSQQCVAVGGDVIAQIPLSVRS